MTPPRTRFGKVTIGRQISVLQWTVREVIRYRLILTDQLLQSSNRMSTYQGHYY
jgi:hypothetical protein